MASLDVEALTVRFGERAVLDAVGLAVDERETVCVLGPSGSGKSTLLRAVAGLQETDAGRVRLAGRDQAGIPAHRRGLGLMFQDHQLFPQRDVAGNVAFGLRMQGVRRDRAAARVAELLDLVGLPGSGGRAVASLSGGEQQRVALARALAPEPRLLMLDEPLGQLDRGLRERLVVELRQLFDRLGTTVLAVTHDQGEAFALAHRVVIMAEGRVAQSGTPMEVWQRPASAFVARFLGFDNLIAATVKEPGAETAHTAWGPLPVPPGTPEGECTLLVRPAGVRLVGAGKGPGKGSEDGPGDGPRARVLARTFRGDHLAVLLDVEGAPRLEASCALRDAPAVGEAVRPRFDAAEIVRLPPVAADGGPTRTGAARPAAPLPR
ncbi:MULTISPECIES: ABC transporter ATP-binding protein [unclassified Streptomyces]|uniref:ABC transporter ATP-binding protein n=1 Tax=unclassified Streptomyces TaxID=2593676 RepID=UPI0022B620F8|nr:MULTISPECIES: ABC transporter ATP-binding protein [unclassified Streptomyces]MCZ7416255.1 ABC transporter ATP-binding protein [Streptomyces sp. WMMC897]MCZ7433935.1 ABC transporter ATP-binding protein [Streptomyces sp. WMMC1477]